MERREGEKGRDRDGETLGEGRERKQECLVRVRESCSMPGTRTLFIIQLRGTKVAVCGVGAGCSKGYLTCRSHVHWRNHVPFRASPKDI